MRTLSRISAIIISSIILCGCLTTLYPIFRAQDVVTNDNLVGYWRCLNKQNETTGFLNIKKIPDDRKNELSEKIRKVADKGYLVSMLNPGGEMDGLFFVFLVKIGNSEYFDFYPAETEVQKTVNADHKSHFLKFHTSYKCEVKDTDHFAMKLFDKGFLEELISKQQIRLRYEVTGDGKKIITATTEELQKFISQYGDSPKAYTADVSYCVRMANL